MINITVSRSAEGAKKYLTHGLQKEGNYFFDKQIKAFWAGKTSQILGIEGKEVTEENFSRMVNRVHPENIEIKLGVRYSQEARAGVDLTYSAPKCATLLHSLTKNSKILEMHRRSYQAAMLEAEKMMFTQNNTKYARGYTHTGNLSYAAFDHFLSRPVDVEHDGKTIQIADPQLHTHCFVPNVTWNEKTGRYEAIEIYNLHKNSDYLRTVYHNHLALELEAAGFQTERDGNFVKLAGVPREQIERFSARSIEIDMISTEKGLSAKQKGELAKLTRKAKSKMSLSDQELYKYWVARVSEQELKDLKSLQGKKFDRLDPINAKQAVDRALEYAFERVSVENEKKVIAYGAKLGYGHLTIEQVTKELRSRDNILKSEDETIDVITLRELVHEEDRMIEMATSGKGKFPSQDLNLYPVPDFFNQQQRKALAEKGLKSDTIAGLLSNPKAQEKLQNNVLLIDEAAMIGVKNMSALLELGTKYQCRIILSGDTRQMGPPAQYGDALRILEKQSRLQVSTVDKIMRQRHAPEYQSAVQDLAKGRILEGYQKLNKQGQVLEIPEHKQRISKLASDYVDTLAQKHSALVVSPTHYEGDLINQAVRTEMRKRKLIQGKEKTFDNLKDISLRNAEKKDLLSYQKGQVIRFSKNQKGGYKAGSHHEVIEVSKNKEVKVRDLKTGRLSHLPYDNPEHFSVHIKHAIQLSQGDRIRLTHNAMSLQGTRMANGTVYEVNGFNKRGIELSNGKTIPNDLYHFRYGISETPFSAQGKDSNTVLLSMSDLSQGGINEKAFYVGVSRGTKQVRVYTSDKDFLKKSIMRSEEPKTARDVANAHQQRMLLRQKRSYQKDLEQKMKSHERVQGRETTLTRGLSKDHHNR